METVTGGPFSRFENLLFIAPFWDWDTPVTPRTVEGRYHWGGVHNKVIALLQSRCITACGRICSGWRRSSRSGSLPSPRTRSLLRAYYRSLAGIKSDLKLQLGCLGGKECKGFRLAAWEGLRGSSSTVRSKVARGILFTTLLQLCGLHSSGTS